MWKKVQDLNYSKWIVVFTDGDDNASKLADLEGLKKKFQESEINLIVVGIELQDEFAEDLIELCKSSKDGAFIRNVCSNDLNI